ncbi:hypothetical protein MMZ06_35370, partial [Burkholderia gladioli]|nr:hypothetical protein [Burkholderia gladioli]
MILFLFQRLAVTVGLTVTTLASCATPNAVSDGIFLGSGPALAMVLTCLISSGHFNLGERPRLLQLNNTA